jgi:pimeloyl-ACP methyl ester carboxylesterase
MRLFHCTCALLLTLAAPLFAQQAAPAAPGATSTYLVFLNGRPIGRETLTVRTGPEGATISGDGQIGAPINLMTSREEIRYRADWTPESVTLDGRLNNVPFTQRTTFRDGSAVSEGTNPAPFNTTDPIGPRTVVLPNTFFTAHEALGRRLVANGETSGEFHAFVAPGVDVPFTIRSATTSQMQTGTTTFPVRRFELLFANATGELLINLVTDERGSLIRLTVPAQALDVVRDDIASSNSRTNVYANPGDEAVTIPAAGFNLGATLTRPQGASLPARLPAVVLLAGTGVNDRDGYAAGIPILGQLAGAFADAGFLVVRYDKRGYGQSGGRTESVTLTDYAEDARTIVTWLSKRKDIDPKRIALVGHSEGAWVALLAASREKRVAAVAAIAAPSTTGSELVLEQQGRALEQINAEPAERQQKIELQQKIHAAVLSGKGWEDIPAPLRQQADTPWFQSLLAYDPAKVVDDVRQPMLFVQGQLDRQVPIEHLERIADLARRTSKSKSVEVVSVRGVNHLLVPAVTGEVSEYGTLTDRTVSGEVTTAIAGWLTRTFAAIK